MDSILDSVKKALGITSEYTHFDDDILMAINTALSTLFQIGLGNGQFVVSSKDETWSAYLAEHESQLELVKTYVYAKVRSIFDPPSSSTHNDALNRTISELEWRINSYVENPDAFNS